MERANIRPAPSLGVRKTSPGRRLGRTALVSLGLVLAQPAPLANAAWSATPGLSGSSHSLAPSRIAAAHAAPAARIAETLAAAPASPAPVVEAMPIDEAVAVAAVAAARPEMKQSTASAPYAEAVRSRASSASADARTGRSVAPNLFGSVAVPIGRSALQSRWDRVVADIRSGGSAGRGMIVRASGGGLEGRVRAVNAEVNRMLAFRPDTAVYGRSDHWATLGESRARAAGDCEDFAIAKMTLLVAQGVPLSDMFLVLVKDQVRRADHAVLAVRVDGRFLILDNQTDRVLEHTQVRDYRPIMTFAAGRAFVHGWRETPADQAPAAPASRPLETRPLVVAETQVPPASEGISSAGLPTFAEVSATMR
jgi:predicted transglutaminase-like cysteine proteinase